MMGTNIYRCGPGSTASKTEPTYAVLYFFLLKKKKRRKKRKRKEKSAFI
jgi:hypothetical protein